MRVPPPQVVIGALIAVVVVVYLAGLPGRGAGGLGPRFGAAARPGQIPTACPRCGAGLWVGAGAEVPCPGCGVGVAGCADCWTPLAADGPRFPDPAGRGWLCPTHHAQRVWEAGKLAELDAPAANEPPPDAPRAEAIRGYVGARLRQARLRGRDDFETFTTAEELHFWEKRQRPADVPEAVRESAELYRRRDPDRAWTWMGVYRVRCAGADAFVVWCVAEGTGDGWLEAFDADGTPAGYGRTRNEVVTWQAKAAVRRSLFGGGRDRLR